MFSSIVFVSNKYDSHLIIKDCKILQNKNILVIWVIPIVFLFLDLIEMFFDLEKDRNGRMNKEALKSFKVRHNSFYSPVVVHL